jgi:cytochrome b561
VRYGYVAQALHWIIVGLLIVQVTLGNIADDLPLGLEKLVTLARHKSFGITILGLAVIRLAWRGFNPPPPEPPMPRWQLAAARINHWALYAILFAMPITGWLMSSASNIPRELVRTRATAGLRRARPGLKETFEEVHESLAYVLYALAGLHVAAALKHQFVDKDGLIFRMLPGGKP